ncbi:hypothetical protein EBZ80_20240 [bacterium]|nr:hypothetical protein [bacterium]
MSIAPETLAWLRQTAKFEGGVTAQAILHLLERVQALEADATEQSQSSSFCNEAIVRRLEALEQRPIPGFVDLATPTPEAAPVVTDKKRPFPPHIAITYQPKSVYEPLAPEAAPVATDEEMAHILERLKALEALPPTPWACPATTAAL